MVEKSGKALIEVAGESKEWLAQESEDIRTKCKQQKMGLCSKGGQGP